MSSRSNPWVGDIVVNSFGICNLIWENKQILEFMFDCYYESAILSYRIVFQHITDNLNSQPQSLVLWSKPIKHFSQSSDSFDFDNIML